VNDAARKIVAAIKGYFINITATSRGTRKILVRVRPFGRFIVVFL
jgi:hypothetical protein